MSCPGVHGERRVDRLAADCWSCTATQCQQRLTEKEAWSRAAEVAITEQQQRAVVAYLWELDWTGVPLSAAALHTGGPAVLQILPHPRGVLCTSSHHHSLSVARKLEKAWFSWKFKHLLPLCCASTVASSDAIEAQRQHDVAAFAGGRAQKIEPRLKKPSESWRGGWSL